MFSIPTSGMMFSAVKHSLPRLMNICLISLATAEFPAYITGIFILLRLRSSPLCSTSLVLPFSYPPHSSTISAPDSSIALISSSVISPEAICIILPPAPKLAFLPASIISDLVSPDTAILSPPAALLVESLSASSNSVSLMTLHAASKHSLRFIIASECTVEGNLSVSTTS